MSRSRGGAGLDLRVCRERNPYHLAYRRKSRPLWATSGHTAHLTQLTGRTWLCTASSWECHSSDLKTQGV